MSFTEEQLRICSDARKSPFQATIIDLLRIFVPVQPGLGLLTRLQRLAPVLEALGLDVSPPLDEGDIESSRMLHARSRETTIASIEDEIRQGEGQLIEFKSTFSCCLRTLRSNPDLERRAYRKSEVETSALKAMAGLMNSGGGTLLLGVEDDGKLVGVEPDLYALEVPNIDRWLLHVRNRIQDGFIDGRGVSASLSIDPIEIGGRNIARISVRPRRRLAFLKNSKFPTCPPVLYRRVGNQTLEVTTPDLEEFFEERALLLGRR